MLHDKSIAEYLLSTVVERTWNAHLNQIPHYVMVPSETRSIYELERIAICAMRVTGSWEGYISCSADLQALDVIAESLLTITAKLTFNEKRSALLGVADFVYQYLSVAIGRELMVFKPAITEFQDRPPAWLFGTAPVYDKCIRIGAGRFWLTAAECGRS